MNEAALECPLHGRACSQTFNDPESLRLHVLLSIETTNRNATCIPATTHGSDQPGGPVDATIRRKQRSASSGAATRATATLRKQQDREYRQSLQDDKRKEQERAKEERRKCRVMKSRERLLQRHQQDMARHVRNRVRLRFTFRGNHGSATIDYAPRHELRTILATLHRHVKHHSFKPTGLFDPTTRVTVPFEDNHRKTLRDLDILTERRLMVLENDT